jgi:hypothetical protein
LLHCRERPITHGTVLTRRHAAMRHTINHPL